MTDRLAPPALLPRVALHDAAATRACIDRYGGLIWSLARRSCEGSADAEDAVQEIFIDLWKSAARFDPAIGSEVTFVATIARRRLIDRRRRRLRRLDREPLPDVIVDPGSGESASSSTEVHLVGKALDQLRPEQRTMLLMSAYDGRSHGEIAKALSVPLGTVKANIRRGLIAVRRALLGPSSDPERDADPDGPGSDVRPEIEPEVDDEHS